MLSLSSTASSEALLPEESSSSSSTSITVTATDLPTPRPDEPNLFNIPSDLHPVYRPLPLIVRMATALLSLAVSALTMEQELSRVLPQVVAPSSSLYKHWKQLMRLVLQAIALTIATNGALQEVFRPPSRVSIQTLMDRYWLPSKLSRYERFSSALGNSNNNNNNSLGVHFLEYQNDASDNKSSSSGIASNVDAIYMNHGFGASSLSWLPVLPRLVQRLGARVGLGHDAAGFGWSERPTQTNHRDRQYLRAYTMPAAGRTGLAVLQSRIISKKNNNNNKLDNPSQQSETEDANDDDGSKATTVLLLGHSMGALSTLHMALEMDPSIRQRIILVAPALGLRDSNSNENKDGRIVDQPSSARRKQRSRGGTNPATLVRSLAVHLWQAPAAYLLRRVVGAKNFWKKGLELVWGDPAKLTDSDVLRFQWPSMGQGWERGLLEFSRAQQKQSLLVPAEQQYSSDRELLQHVLDRPNVESVHVIVGTRDKVVPTTMVRQFLETFSPALPVVEMEGLGHDPFEEDVESFVRVVESCLGGSGANEGAD